MLHRIRAGVWNNDETLKTAGPKNRVETTKQMRQ